MKKEVTCYFVTGQAHSSVERAGLLGGVKFHLIEPDSQYKLRGEALAERIRADKEKGLIPFYVSLDHPFSHNPKKKTFSALLDSSPVFTILTKTFTEYDFYSIQNFDTKITSV